ncbi:unnamed protein product [Dracunculus medinensis]|uniref:Cadherin domain-containing protein n=1 Tax=Dracunculus medinensis TaxID=318479 RepID=A0A0N4U5L3_DRAME|nr:unnamed protein product [Dracunculus medinensis]
MRCNKLRPESGVVVYRVEPETSPFDVTPLSGDVFSRYNILNGRYHFDIVATDSFGQEARTSAKVIVEGDVDQRYLKKFTSEFFSDHCDEKIENLDRIRRDMPNDIIFSLREDQPLGWLNKRIILLPHEKIANAPVEKEYVTIYSNGSLMLIKQLNYEIERKIKFAVHIENPLRSKHHH